jgi:uncharacterized protein
MLARMRPVSLAIAAVLAASAAVSASPLPAPAASPAKTDVPRVLVFTRTAGYRHEAIPTTIATLRALGAQAGIEIDASEDPMHFDDATLAGYRAVVFAHTTGEVLDADQQAAFERYVGHGGGYLGIHAAADSGYTWPWYGDLVGAWFARHPEGLQAVRVVFEQTPAPLGLREWQVVDEIYDYRRNPRADVRVIASIDPNSHASGGMGDDHPIAWCHARAGGRAWYTGLGHDPALYADPVFGAHLLQGLRWTTGQADAC